MNVTLLQMVSLVIGNMIGAGSYMMPMALAKYKIYAVIGWGISSIGAIFLAKLFAKMMILLPKEGAPYSYAESVFGRFIGFQMSWGYWIMCPIGSASLMVSIIGTFNSILPIFSTNVVLGIVISALIIVIFSYINLKGVHNTLRIQTIVTFLKLIPLILFSVIALYYFFNLGNSDVLSKYMDVKKVDFFDSILSSAALTFWSFVGLESATIPVGVDSKIVSKATVIGVIFTACLYLLSLVGIFYVVPYEVLSTSMSPFVDAVRILFGDGASKIMAIAALLCFIGSLNGWILIQGQVGLSAAKSGIFPKIFAKLNLNGVPYFGVIFGSVIIIIVTLWQSSNVFTDQFENIILLASFCTLIPYVYFCSATFIIANSCDNISCNAKKAIIILSLIGVAYSVSMVIGAGIDTVFIGTVMFLLISPLYISIMKK